MFSSIEEGPREEDSKKEKYDPLQNLRDRAEACSQKIFELQELEEQDGKSRAIEIAQQKEELRRIEDEFESSFALNYPE